MNDPYRPPEQVSPPTEEVPSLKGKRPLPVTILCCLGVLGGAPALLVGLFQSGWGSGGWLPLYLIFSCVVGLTCMYGFWKMRKWAFFTYIALFCANQVVTFLIGAGWNVASLAGAAIFMGVTGLYYKRLI